MFLQYSLSSSLQLRAITPESRFEIEPIPHLHSMPVLGRVAVKISPPFLMICVFILTSSTYMSDITDGQTDTA